MNWIILLPNLNRQWNFIKVTEFQLCPILTQLSLTFYKYISP